MRKQQFLCDVNGNGLEYGLELGTALVDFCAKCGFIECARQVFDKMPSQDVTAWSAMIMGLALNGRALSICNQTFLRDDKKMR